MGLLVMEYGNIYGNCLKFRVQSCLFAYLVCGNPVELPVKWTILLFGPDIRWGYVCISPGMPLSAVIFTINGKDIVDFIQDMVDVFMRR
jgi:hypothetical protein